MAIPVYLQQFKAAGIYRVIFDKSTILNTDTSMLRLVVGYSEKGPFNTPVYINDPAEFKTVFGDISRKLEKRGVFFHRLALQMLQVSPILCLNLKKFNGETVSGATISTAFNSKFDPIDTVKLNIEDIFDTTRFWEYDESQLNNLRSVDGTILDQYINICVKDVKSNSGTFFIRKANGAKVSGYNITVNNWYKDENGEIPEYLEGHENNLISDFFAEIYVFKGRFTAKQVLASETLKNYFVVTDDKDENGEQIIKLRDRIYDAFGDSIDPLDALYQDEASGAIGHWIGSLIPDFKNKQGSYAALNVLFNSDSDVHNMMMSFNTELLEEDGSANIDLSGRLFIPTNDQVDAKKAANNNLSLAKIYKGEAKTTLLGNIDSPVVADQIDFSVNILNNGKPIIDLTTNGKTKISGTLYVSSVSTGGSEKEIIGVEDLVASEQGDYTLTLTQVGSENSTNPDDSNQITISADNPYMLLKLAKKLGVVVYSAFKADDDLVLTNDPEYPDYNIQEGDPKSILLVDGYGTYFNGIAFNEEENGNILDGPEKIITTISRLEGGYSDDKSIFTDIDNNLKVNFMNVDTITNISYMNRDFENSVYGASVSFINFNDNVWNVTDEDGISINGIAGCQAIYSEDYCDKSLLSILHVGDTVLADDGAIDNNNDGEVNEFDKDTFYDNVYVQEIGTEFYTEKDIEVTNGTKFVGQFKFYYIKFSGTPLTNIAKPSDADKDLSMDCMLIRVDTALNKEIGKMVPHYLEGYTYKNDRPNGTGMYAKVEWQQFILSTLTDYKGLRTGLLNKSEVDYRYVVDTFESFPVSGLKQELSYLCKEKQSAFCIANFPAIKTFTKCPYTSFTNDKGIFNIQYVIDGYNKKKSAAIKFSLPQESNGASFVAFYTPLKFSDGYIDNVIPSAGIVSNLFVNKYMTRNPYDIIAGPNFGSISAAGLVGPDHKYTQDELQIIEPFGVNCMVYRPNFGTFINANQTAKQTPVSALSKVHVRELVIYIQDEMEKILQRHQWEFNNQITRNAILDQANAVCELVRSNGGLIDYRNIMDESNNTDEIIDNEMAILSTHIEPGRGMGKMVHELHIYRTGEMRSSLAE